MSDEIQDRRIEKLEERVNQAERDIAALSSKLHLMNDDLSRRISDINNNLKEDVERIRLDLRERIHELKGDLKDDIHAISNTLDDLETSISTLSQSLQGMYIAQSGSNVKVKVNEKIIWAILGILATVGLYLVQDLIKTAG